MINIQSGGTVIAAWEVDNLPDEWVDVYLGIATDLPDMQQARQKVQAHMEKHRQSHPTYRKKR